MARNDDLRVMPAKNHAAFAASRDHVERVFAAAAERSAISSLIGLTVNDARRRVDVLGGEFADDRHTITTKLDPNRVVVSVTTGALPPQRLADVAERLVALAFGRLGLERPVGRQDARLMGSPRPPLETTASAAIRARSRRDERIEPPSELDRWIDIER